MLISVLPGIRVEPYREGIAWALQCMYKTPSKMEMLSFTRGSLHVHNSAEVDRKTEGQVYPSSDPATYLHNK